MAEMICNCRQCDGKVHVIGVGDTLYRLSRYYNVSVGDIMKANKGINPYNLMVGEKICIPMKRMPREAMQVDTTPIEAMPIDTMPMTNMQPDINDNDYLSKCMQCNQREIKSVENYDIEFFEMNEEESSKEITDNMSMQDDMEEMSMKDAVDKMSVKEFVDYVKKSYM